MAQLEETFPMLKEESVRYIPHVAAKVAGTSVRQLDYWVKTGVVRPSIKAAGSRIRRGYSSRDILALAVTTRLLEAGVTLPAVRMAVKRLQGRDVTELAQIVLLSNGK